MPFSNLLILQMEGSVKGTTVQYERYCVEGTTVR